MIRAAILAALLAGAVSGTALASDPATLGGTLGATRSEIIFESTASVPMSVTLTAPEGWQLDGPTFRVEPSGRHVVRVIHAGEDGQVVAVAQAIDVPGGTDRSALVLALGLPKPPQDTPWWLLLVVLPVLYIVRRAQSRPWRVRRGPK